MTKRRTEVNPDPVPGAAPAAAISARGLRKSFGDVRALDGVDFDVAPGTVLGLLGPNGAGKTTAVRVLTTLLTPDAGSATVAGLDVVRDAAALREQIGLAGQYAAVDENLTGLENLVMVGRLYGMPRAAAKARAPRAAGALRPRRGRRARRQDVLRRHAAAAGPRRGTRRQAARAVPRRADDGPGPAQPPGAVDDDRGARRRGDDRPADDAVPRRGRPPRRHDRGHRPRPRHRRGHARRAEGPRRRRAPRGPPRRRRRRAAGDRGARADVRRAAARPTARS